MSNEMFVMNDDGKGYSIMYGFFVPFDNIISYLGQVKTFTSHSYNVSVRVHLLVFYLQSCESSRNQIRLLLYQKCVGNQITLISY